MEQTRRYGNLFRLDGTNQLQRIPVPLENTYIQPDERSLTDLLCYARRLAEQIRFYNLSGQAVGDWRAFFGTLEDQITGDILSTFNLETLLNGKQDWPPHVALFLVFLKLYEILQEDINELPIRHLRYYYETALGLQRRQAQRDSVHVIFELAKNAQSTLIEADTELDGGKDSQGNALIYTTTTDIVVAHSEIKSTYRLVQDTDRRGKQRFFSAREIGDSEGDSWHTFGRTQLDLDVAQRTMEEADVGFALESPTLLLGEGRREIHIVLTLRRPAAEFPADHYFSFALRAELSGEEGWLSPDYFSAHLVNNGIDQPALDIHMVVEETASPIVAADTELHPEAPPADWPVVRFLLIGESGHYSVIEGIEVEHAAISVNVSGVKNLIVQNEETVLNTEKPIPLFGNQPHVGSVFYVGSDEILSKQLSSLTLKGDWQDKPADLFEHYNEYFTFTNATFENNFDSGFQIDIDMLYQRTWVRLLDSKNMFDFAVPDYQEFAIDLSDPSFVEGQFGENQYRAQPQVRDTRKFTASSKFGFVRFVLTDPTYGAPYAPEIPFNAFGHKAFAPRYAQQAIELSRSTDTDITLPKDPYTPTLANFSADYRASSDFAVGDVLKEDRFYTIDFFGTIEADSKIPARLLPEVDGQASLFIGIENSPIPVTVSLLFQLDKGTATASEALAKGETQWSYLSHKEWTSIASSDILIDATQGFQKAGIVSMAVGATATIDHQRMPGDLLWLRASIDRTPDSACRVFGISDRAVLSQLKAEDDELESYEQHLQAGLKPETISKLIKRNAAIKKVNQPHASFSGLRSEEDLLYFQSSSERLRHRQRAVTLWDMERLVLNEFPSVFKVKCLPHSDARGERKAGQLALVIIPNLRSVTTNNPLEPRADAVLMTDISDFVGGLCTPYATAHVIHPVYERILVDAQVTFAPGYDAGYYASVLNEELKRFLSPWAYNDGQDIVFGTRIYRSEILAFMEGREYIDNITNFDLYHSYSGPRRDGIGDMAIEQNFIVYPKPVPAINDMEIGSTFIVGRGVEVAAAASGHAILVSHPKHRIAPVSTDDHACSGVDQLGIGYMTVELDFVVAAS